jgi:hypothetical protein
MKKEDLKKGNIFIWTDETGVDRRICICLENHTFDFIRGGFSEEDRRYFAEYSEILLSNCRLLK